jgi:hypothetical protein
LGMERMTRSLGKYQIKVMLELPTRRVPQQGLGDLGPASAVIDHFVGVCCGLT